MPDRPNLLRGALAVPRAGAFLIRARESWPLALVPVVIFGFVDTMYLAQEKAYRDLYDTVVATVRDGSYQREGAFNAKAPRGFSHVVLAFTSWSIWPIYGGLIAAYFVAQDRGWLLLLAIPPKP